ncbi:MAG: hypothetical protein K9G47_08405 [Bacteroidales bacterium]|nr:hypothetical protein [Bacteroidales bacterium]
MQKQDCIWEKLILRFFRVHQFNEFDDGVTKAKQDWKKQELTIYNTGVYKHQSERYRQL